MSTKQIFGDNQTTFLTLAGTQYSSVMQARDGEAISVHLEWTGTPTATLTLWYSNKPNPSAANDNDWVQDTTFSPTNPAGSASKGFYTIGNLVALHVRIKCVLGAGAGTLGGWSYIAKAG
jgi:hypothetical protein